MKIINNEKLRINNERGFAQVILIVVLSLGIVALSATSYYLLKAQGKAPVGKTSTLYPVSTPLETVAPVAKTDPVISSLKDTRTIETEISNTNLDSIDSDINALLGSANSI